MANKMATMRGCCCTPPDGCTLTPVSFTTCDPEGIIACLNNMLAVVELEFGEDSQTPPCDISPLSGSYILPWPVTGGTPDCDTITQNAATIDCAVVLSDCLGPDGSLPQGDRDACHSVMDLDIQCVDGQLCFDYHWYTHSPIDTNGAVLAAASACLDLPLDVSSGFTVNLTPTGETKCSSGDESYPYAFPLESATLRFFGQPCTSPDGTDCGVLSASITIDDADPFTPDPDHCDVEGTINQTCRFVIRYTITSDCPIVAAYVAGAPGISSLPIPCPEEGITINIGSDECGGHVANLKFIFIDSKGCRYEETRTVECCQCTTSTESCPPSGSVSWNIRNADQFYLEPTDPGFSDYPGGCPTDVKVLVMPVDFTLFGPSGLDCSPAGITDTVWAEVQIFGDGQPAISFTVGEGETFTAYIQVGYVDGLVSRVAGSTCFKIRLVDCLGCASDWEYHLINPKCVFPPDSCDCSETDDTFCTDE